MNYAEEFAAASPIDGAYADHVRRSATGLVIKQHRERGRAVQEFNATAMARMLLPPDIIPFNYVGHGGNYFLANHVDGRRLDHVRREDVIAAVKYLATLHSSLPSQEAANFLRQRGHCHYERECLANRLEEEVKYVRRLFGDSLADRMESSACRLASHVRDEIDVVLGHGDYQAENILVGVNGVHPVDWLDFGLCYRWYEVAHFLWSVDDRHHAAALEEYRAGTGTDHTTCLAIGHATDAIVRAGSVARRVSQGADKDPEARCRRHIERLEMAMEQWTGGAS